MNMKPCIDEKISIIIPVYNVEKYIERCLDSVLAQVHTNFEVLCVDDGSLDNSGEICDRYQKQDNRIKVFHLENHGVSYARNYALSKIEGEWFCFVDADDCIEADYLSELYGLAKNNECDIAACAFFKEQVCSLNEVNTENEYNHLVLNSSKDCVRNFICGINSMHGMVWNKLYSAEKFSHLQFRTDISINEDCLYTYEIMKQCSKACITLKPLYHWIIRVDSACHAKPQFADFQAANVFYELYKLTQEESDLDITRALQKNYIGSAVRVLNNAIYDKDMLEVKEARERCKEWRKYAWSSMNTQMKLKYIWAIYGRYYLKKD